MGEGGTSSSKAFTVAPVTLFPTVHLTAFRLSSPGHVLEVKPERHPNDDEEENAYSAKASSSDNNSGGFQSLTDHVRGPLQVKSSSAGSDPWDVTVYTEVVHP